MNLGIVQVLPVVTHGAITNHIQDKLWITHAQFVTIPNYAPGISIAESVSRQPVWNGTSFRTRNSSSGH
ncbi:hypothetical protein PG987_004975 [Apiospora arundinis]